MYNARLLALQLLIKVHKDKAYSNIIFDNVIKSQKVSTLDAGFISNLFYGTLERSIELDYIISKYSKIPLNKLNLDTLIILRMGIYQILYMDKVPNSAAVNESVKLCKKRRQFNSSGFVNAILRNVVRDGNEAYTIKKSENSVEYLSIKYSVPINIINCFIYSYGFNITKKLLKSFLNIPPIIVRVNTLKISKIDLINYLKLENVTAIDCGKEYEALKLNLNGKSISELKSFKNGFFHVQNLASQILCKLIPIKSGNTVIDVCSAPGGKAFTLAQIMKNKGEIYAFDLYSEKIKLLNSNSKRLSISIIKPKVKDALIDVKNNLNTAEVVLCDVPCSGLGVLSKKPEIKYKCPKKLDSFPDMQYRILCNAQKYVKKNGVLIYSTCTLNKKENNEIANKFLNEHTEYEPFKLLVPLNVKRYIEEPPNQLTLMPFNDYIDGFFISAFKKSR